MAPFQLLERELLARLALLRRGASLELLADGLCPIWMQEAVMGLLQSQLVVETGWDTFHEGPRYAVTPKGHAVLSQQTKAAFGHLDRRAG